MRSRHVMHLLTRYVHGQLRPSQQARVMNHIRACPQCRAALVREDQLAAELRREMPTFGQPGAGQLAHVWAGVWDEISAPANRRRSGGWSWLPGISLALAMLLVLAFALPLITRSEGRVQAAPQQPRPQSQLVMASPTPGQTDEAPTLERSFVQSGLIAAGVEPTAPTLVNAGASPVPVPQATVSPVARSGSTYQR
jgi:anti-sigma factor RsiW